MLMVTPMLGQKGAKVLLDECGSIEEVLRKAREEPKSLIKLKGIGKLTVEKLKALLGGKSIFSKYSKTKKKKPTVTKEERIANIKQKHAIQKSMYSKLSGAKKK